MLPESPGKRRVVIEGVSPEIDGGRWPIKRTTGESVTVEADVFADGHDRVAAVLRWRREQAVVWRETPMTPRGNDRFRAEFPLEHLGRYRYTIDAYVDAFGTWQAELERRMAAGQDLSLALRVGADLLAGAAARAGADAGPLYEAARVLTGPTPADERARRALAPALAELAARYRDRAHDAVYGRELGVWVDRPKARFSTWYELFPRSAAPEPGRHGTLADVEARLPHLAALGFDVLYLPPIHPIGHTHRKGAENALTAQPEDPGSPWAIGSPEGGHKAVHPELGTLDDLRRLVARAAGFGIDVALDVALQCSPDHPYLTEHPEWFRRLPDGSIRHAENPPKKYEDIVPFDFETAAHDALWRELRSIFTWWVAQGVRVFRVDNPHTKPLPFWAWLIEGLKREHPDLIFLAEAFTRPKVMYALAKAGFTQSYNYFPWRNHRGELAAYFTELTRAPVSEYFRANLWPNTPDILTEYLQHGGAAAFRIRLVLAATLGASYGIYGPPFERMESQAHHAGGEEYRHSEKYAVRHWPLAAGGTLEELIRVVNRARRENEALQYDGTLHFHNAGDENLLCYSKRAPGGGNTVLCVVNLDPFHTHSGWTHLDLGALGLGPDREFQVHDLVGGATYPWRGAHNFVELDPQVLPAHVFQVRARARHETDFAYYE
jgi:starch synthase (maltosyl-transferring)